jgi:hypothetical protein
MRTGKLTRFFSSDEGTPGMLFIDGRLDPFETLELPWRDNQRDLSCIPAGEYVCVWRDSPSKGPCYHVTNVNDRGWILIHAGNWAGDTEKGFRTDVLGCILIGTRHGRLAGQRAVIRSRPAMLRFMEELNGESLLLTIENLWESHHE